MPPRSRARIGLLDSVIILNLACMMVLFLLWISAQLRGTQQFGSLPDWLTGTASSFWTYLTGTASSTLLALLRRRDGQGPNYLLWILGTVIVMLLVVFAVAFIIPPPPPPKRVLLRFSLKSDTQDRPNLSFLQKYPLYLEPHAIAAESDGHYQEHVDFPGGDGRFYARTVRAVTTSRMTEEPLNPVTELCFKRNPKPPGNDAPLVVRMNCSEGKRCSVSKDDDPGWAAICSADSDWMGRIRLVQIVHAQSSKVLPGWKVPSLETLRKMADRERVGYTEFSIKSAQLGALKEVDSFQYLIKVNGSPLYVDGWGPEDMLKPFDSRQGFTFSFGLENLSFSGADNGCEDIEVRLLFRQKDRVIKEATISRKYAALRDADLEEVKTEDGTLFTWSGKYVKPQKEDRTELFILSTPDLREVKNLKARIDAAGLSYDGMGVVAVLRPPLNNPSYGIVIGLRQPTGQIRFTYDTQSAQKLHNWIIKGQNKNLFRHDAFLYQMRPGDAGTGKYKSCSATAKRP